MFLDFLGEDRIDTVASLNHHAPCQNTGGTTDITWHILETIHVNNQEYKWTAADAAQSKSQFESSEFDSNWTPNPAFILSIHKNIFYSIVRDNERSKDIETMDTFIAHADT